MEYFIAAVFGLIVGSFLNVCIYRMPKGESIVWPGSKCQSCGAHIKWYDNIPLLSFAILRAKCRNCHAPIAWRYPLVESLAGTLAVIFTHRYMLTPGWLFISLAAAYMLLALSFIDMDHMIIPDELSLGLAALGLATCWLNPYFAGGMWKGFAPSLGGAATGFFLLWGVAWFGELIFKKEAMGGGDIKLMAGVGAVLGWQGVLSTLMIGSFFGAVYGLALMAQKRVGSKDPIPFGPFLSLAALINLYHLVQPSAFMIG